MKTIALNIPVEVFAVKAKDTSSRIKSTSGGVFATIAKEIITNKGIVFGASYTNDFHAIQHIGISQTSDIDKLRGSKYAQSNMNNTYSETYRHLVEGKDVFYSGLPCQIAGLNNFLKRPYDNLYTCSLICHGIPKRILYESYISYLEDTFNSKIIRLNFRNKVTGWKNSSVVAEFRNGRKYKKKLHLDPYMIAYSNCYLLKHCCGTCKFKNIEQVSDITIGDFWGVKSEYPDFFDNKGVSVVLINNSKGRKLFEMYGSAFEILESNIAIIKKHNPRLLSPSQNNTRSNEFENELNEMGFKYVKNKYLKPQPIWKGSAYKTIKYWVYHFYLRISR